MRIQLGVDTPIYVTLYGTGIRGAPSGCVAVLIDGNSVPVLYAGAQPQWDGLDQINIELPVDGELHINPNLATSTSG